MRRAPQGHAPTACTSSSALPSCTAEKLSRLAGICLPPLETLDLPSRQWSSPGAHHPLPLSSLWLSDTPPNMAAGQIPTDTESLLRGKAMVRAVLPLLLHGLLLPLSPISAARLGRRE